MLLALLLLLATACCTSVTIVQPQYGDIFDYEASFDVLVESTPPASNITVFFNCVGNTPYYVNVVSGETTSITPTANQTGTCLVAANYDTSQEVVFITILSPNITGTANITVPLVNQTVIAGGDGSVDILSDSGMPPTVDIAVVCPGPTSQSFTIPSNGTYLVTYSLSLAGSCHFIGVSRNNTFVFGAPVVNISSPLTMTTPAAGSVFTSGENVTVQVDTPADYPPSLSVILVLTCAKGVYVYSQETLVNTPVLFSIPSVFSGACTFTSSPTDFYVAITPVNVAVNLGAAGLATILRSFNSASFQSQRVQFSSSSPTR